MPLPVYIAVTGCRCSGSGLDLMACWHQVAETLLVEDSFSRLNPRHAPGWRVRVRPAGMFRTRSVGSTRATRPAGGCGCGQQVCSGLVQSAQPAPRARLEGAGAASKYVNSFSRLNPRHAPGWRVRVRPAGVFSVSVLPLTAAKLSPGPVFYKFQMFYCCGNSGRGG